MDFRRERALAAMLESKTVQAAAEASGIAVSTLRRYLVEDEFSAKLREASRAAMKAATAHASDSLEGAIQVLREIADDATAPVQARIAACDKLLTHALRLTDRYYVLAQLDALEKRLDDAGD